MTHVTGNPTIPPALAEDRVLAILRGCPADVIVKLVAALREGGIRCVEVTLDTPHALDMIGTLRNTFGDALVVGAGTVTDVAAARQALDAGAQLVLSPNTDVDVVREVSSRGVPCFPGAMTPSEIVQGWSAGAAGIKLFPAAALGEPYVRHVRGPLGHIPLMAVGGLDASNARSFEKAGCFAIAIGSWLIGSGPDDRAPALVASRARAALQSMRAE